MNKNLFLSMILSGFMLFSNISIEAQVCGFTANKIEAFTDIALAGNQYVSVPNKSLSYIKITFPSVMGVIGSNSFSVNGFMDTIDQLWTLYFKILIDFDNDGNFSDSTEIVYSSVILNSSFIGNYLIPPGTPTGHYTMRLISSYYKDDPGYVTGCGNVVFGQAYDFKLVVVPATPYIVDTYPTDSTFLQLGVNNPIIPIVYLSRRTGQPEVRLSYRIVGPLPIENIVYRACNSGSSIDSLISITSFNTNHNIIPVAITFRYATGLIAQQSPNNGSFDLITNNASIEDGCYKVIATLYGATDVKVIMSDTTIICLSSTSSVPDIGSNKIISSNAYKKDQDIILNINQINNENFVFKLYDMNGMELKLNYAVENDKIIIPKNLLKQGIYFYSILLNSQIYQNKFIVY